ncbi:MAG: FAD-dependent oxidoreductase [Anaerolineales bacterium]|nr:FAD-dependent oxidoreductase [Anaerolineales bacterium]
MKKHQYLIVGGGMTAAAAMEGIRQADPQGDVGVISAEPSPPYDRPPLSKQLWTGKKDIDEIWRSVPEGIPIYHGRKAVELDLEGKMVTDQEGETYSYDRLLLATGGRPRRLPFGDEKIIYYRTIEDFRRLESLVESHSRFAVIGGGFIGSELAAALAMKGKQVSILFPGTGIGDRMFPADLSQFLNDYYRRHGVEVLAGEKAVGLDGNGTDLTLLTDRDRRISVEGVVAGIGIEPNTGLAQSAGLNIDNGIVVDEHLRASQPHVFAAGDVASFSDPLLGRRRVEHEDAANSMGEAAGRSMAGEAAAYEYSPMFYSDLFDMGYEAVGDLDARLETVADWQEPFRKGVVYYLKEGRVRGVLLWDIWGQVDAARELMADQTPATGDTLIGRLPV